MLKGKKIILGVTASIAAYKSAFIVRLLVKEGAEVKVIITPSAREFVTPVTLSTLSGNPVLSDFYTGKDGTWNSHVELGQWADIMLIAPVTASSMGKMVNGIADNLLVATYMSARCPVILAPAMDLDMYNHPSTRRNIDLLKSYQNHIIEPVTGELASGLYGKGRMEEPEVIVERLREILNDLSGKTGKKKSKSLTGKKILVTAGPTQEKLDPIRFIGNHSSGKMGYAIAETCADHGADVILISGPVSVRTENINIRVIHVTSAAEMHKSCVTEFPGCHAAIMSAAVADFTPKSHSKSKIKIKQDGITLEMVPTKDIAADLGKMKKNDQVVAGFALEVEDEMKNAVEKLQKKNLDFIVLNSLRDEEVDFGTETNKITIIDRNNKIEKFELKPKREVAEDIVRKLLECFKEL